MLWDSTSGTRIHGSFEAQGAVPASGRACPRPGECSSPLSTNDPRQSEFTYSRCRYRSRRG